MPYNLGSPIRTFGYHSAPQTAQHKLTRGRCNYPFGGRFITFYPLEPEWIRAGSAKRLAVAKPAPAR